MLWFWVVVLVVLIGAIAVVAAGAGDAMAEVYDDRPDASLPAGRPLSAEDLRTVRLGTGVRGYRMDEVDALLARLEAEMIEREGDERVRVVDAVAEPVHYEGPVAPDGPVITDGSAAPDSEVTEVIARPDDEPHRP